MEINIPGSAGTAMAIGAAVSIWVYGTVVTNGVEDSRLWFLIVSTVAFIGAAIYIERIHADKEIKKDKINADKEIKTTEIGKKSQ